MTPEQFHEQYEADNAARLEALDEIGALIRATETELAKHRAERLARVREAVQNGHRKTEIGEHLGVSKQIVHRWLREAKDAARMAGERELF